MNFMHLIFENIFYFLKMKKNKKVTRRLSYIKHHEQIIMKAKKIHGQTKMLKMNKNSHICTKAIKEQIDSVVPQVRKMFREHKHCVLVVIKHLDGKEKLITFKNVSTLKQQINLSVAITYAISVNSKIESIITSYIDLHPNLSSEEDKYFINHNNRLSNTRVPFALNRFGLDKESLSNEVNFDFNKPFEAIIQKVNVIEQLEKKLSSFNSNKSEEGLFSYGTQILAPGIDTDASFELKTLIKNMIDSKHDKFTHNLL